MAEQVLILSPHCDDAPLSLGASLVARLLGTMVRVVVVFSRSSYTRLEGCTAPVRRTTALRMTEERRAARAAGYKATFLPFPEPFARPGYRTLGDVIDRRRRPEQEANWAAVRDSLLQIMLPHQGPILAPLGCGDHIDHRAVTACFREFALQLPDVIPIFYEDMPYAARASDRAIRRLVPPEWRGVPVLPVSIEGGEIESKINLLRIYQSQLGDRDLAHVRRHWARRGRAELVWMPETYLAKVFPQASLRVRKIRAFWFSLRA